ncbi:hypothetical protein KFK09_022528 [Dendrobium nobile]|uniref:Copia protein n=1 Tax=Dendrobium nobile TaxID=94219 RepID=A0A8T3AIU2_DENNO|nr:hypothetical protein KFK09_022528 [Dendrobium nobile]
MQIGTWIQFPSDQQPVTIHFLETNFISWSSKKQPIVVRSSTEAEYRALATTPVEIIWLQRLLTDFFIPQQPTINYRDNTSTIALANNPVFHDRTKHIIVDYHFIQDHIQSNEIAVTPVMSTDQTVNIFPKPLPTPRFQLLRSKLIVQYSPVDSLVCGA